MFDSAPVDPAGTTALIVMAVAVSIQTVVIIGALVALVVALRRLESAVDVRYEQLKAHLDEAARPLRQAADAVEHVSTQASAAMDRAGHAAVVLKTLVMAPRTAIVYGVASMAGALFKRWPRRHADDRPITAPRSRVVH